MSVSDLYQQIVLDHSRAPRHFTPLAAHTHAATGRNPLCGDSLRVSLVIDDGRIAQIAFDGEACAITRATASLLGDLVIGFTQAQFACATQDFSRLVAGESDDGSKVSTARPDASAHALGDLNALRVLARYPTRRKCALLPFATLEAALAGSPGASTENSGNLS